MPLKQATPFLGHLYGWVRSESIPDCLKLGSAAAQFYLQPKKCYHPELNTDIQQIWARKLDV